MTAAAGIPPLLTTRQVTERLGVSADTVYRSVAAGRLRATRITPGCPLRFAEHDLAELIERGRWPGWDEELERRHQRRRQ